MKRNVTLYTVDSFTEELFKGNPAGVCILDEELDDYTMQSIAKELKYSETAFILDFRDNIYSIRWFTPEYEVDLCGHATLAASHVLLNDIKIPFDSILYSYNNGVIKASSEEDGKIGMDFPMDEPEANICFDYSEIQRALGVSQYNNVILGKHTGKLVFELKDEKSVTAINPDFEMLKHISIQGLKGVGVTATSLEQQYDFVTRYFNPWAGVNEDYVTGSVHTLLAKYWSVKKNKHDLKAKQLSSREGEIELHIIDDLRVKLTGKARIVTKGEMFL
ncbi:PhzF family phenazine biosynthesis protein [Clostridium sp. C8-1-8]|uniref:PhzF family phenazine biosynthesis protein n=1 Tax=Clostridium sp. C8-1-8 TaxID=2698831 RepID=UPI00136E7944|nr:PhzF family phenazine biosynthesis protein [Clostridium sp. C8-1-8]